MTSGDIGHSTNIDSELNATLKHLRDPRILEAVRERGEPNLGSPQPYLHIRDINASSGQTEQNFYIYYADEQTQTPLGRVQQFPGFRRQNAVFDGPLTLLRDVFLPAGWPGSVSEDYTCYQIFDSLQAFASTIAGLLSSRAVLTGIGVGDSSASPTSALLLHIAQDSTGRLATILFAARLSSALEPEAKFYRLLADVFNDVAIVLDCASPLFPRGVVRVAMLATAGMLRALCGVAAGASKASLSVHFAEGGDGSGNVAELNAKDASQETVISLLGSLVGSIVVSVVVGALETWLVLLSLLAAHLSLNTAAVRAVRMRTLNRQRANLVFNTLFEGKGIKTPNEIGALERIFERDGIVRDTQGRIHGWTRIGIGLEDITQQIALEQQTMASRSEKPILASLMHIFSQNTLNGNTDADPYPAYILYPNLSRSTILIALSSTSTTQHHLRAWAHSNLLHRRLSTLPNSADRAAIPSQSILEMIRATGEELDARWDVDIVPGLIAKGWDLHTGALETRVGRRFSVQRGK